LGALVSGLDAGKIYQSWPLMNDNYFPNDSKFIDLFSLTVFEQASLVQFTHRNLAYLIFFIFLIISYLTIYGDKHLYIKKAVLLVMFALFVQIILGIFTILSGAHIAFASAHQIGSIFLIGTSINLIAKNSIV
jgi:cytochrome c oxidase assembly protein subunit 15